MRIRDRAAADHHQARAVRLRRRDRDRGRHAGGVVRAAPRDQRCCRRGSTRQGADGRRRLLAPTPARRPSRVWVRLLLTAVALAFLGLFLVLPLAAVFAEALHRGLRTPSLPRSANPMRSRRSGSRCWRPRSRCRSTSCSASRPPGRSPSSSSAASTLLDHADRSAVRGLAGHLGPDLRAAVRRAGLVRALAASTTTSRSSSPCPASCSRRSSSRSRSWRAN